MSEQDKQIVRRVPFEAINQVDFDVIDEVVSPDFVEHTRLLASYGTDREAFKRFIRDFRSAHSQLRYTLDRQISKGDLVVQQLTATGTLQREFLGIPVTGRSATWQEMHIARVAGGKIVEHWGLVDMLGAMQQLGALPTPSRAKAA